MTISFKLFGTCKCSSSGIVDIMLLPRLQPPLRAAIASFGRPGVIVHQSSLCEAFTALSVCGRGTSAREDGLRVAGLRFASHKAQGAVNKAKDGPGKRLGAKKSGGMSTLRWCRLIEECCGS